MKKYKKHLIRGAFLTAMVTGLSGCSEFWCWPFDCSSDETSVGIDDSSNTPTATVTDTTQNETAPVTPGGATDFDLNKVVRLHTDVSGWPETKSMTVDLGGGVICLNGSFSTEWPGAEISHTSGAYNITVNAIAPGFTLSDGVLATGMEEVMGDVVRKSSRSIPRDQVPGDLTGALLFLASDGAAFITGQTVAVDGGSYFL